MSETSERWIVDFAGASRLEEVGGKALGLHRLTRLALPVPPGFVVTTAAFRAALTGRSEIAAALAGLAGLRADDTGQIRVAAARVRAAVIATPLPPALAEQTLAAWREITGGARVAVRSSATAEDLAEASFAGQQDSYLDVDGEALLERLRACWASLWSDRAVAYRLRHGHGAADVAMAVVVQQMLAPDAAGVMFTADPVTGRRGEVVLEAVAGLGEALVSGKATPQVYHVHARDRRIGAVTLPANAARLLDDAAVHGLCELGLQAERAAGEPLDLEWALVGTTVWLLQARAITTLPPIPRPGPVDGSYRVYISFGHAQVNTAAFSPLGLSALALLIPIDRDEHGRTRLFATANARMYVDVTPLLSRAPFKDVFPRILSRVNVHISERLASVVGRPELRAQARQVRVELPGLIRRMAPVLARALRGLLRGPKWTHAWFMAGFQGWLAELREADTGGVTPLARLTMLRARLGDMIGELLFGLAVPVLLPNMFGEAKLRRLVREYAPGEADDALVRGLVGNITTDMDLALGDLADVARELPDVAAALVAGDPVAAIAAVRGRPGTGAFYAAWDEFLARHGHRAAGELDLAVPRWHEDPGMLLRTLAGALPRAPGAHRRQHEAATRDAERVLAVVLKGVRRGLFGGLRARRVEELAIRVRTLLALREHHKWAMIVLLDKLRGAALELGKILVARGELRTIDDVWLLSLDELLAAGARAEQGAAPVLQAGELAARRAQLQRDAAWTPPPVLTSEGEAVPAPARAAAPTGVLVGTGVSSGAYEGVVRVVRDPTRETLAAGEILVAAFTDPGWTPLFMHAGAVIIEVGGTLTHGSVIARELGIPAVVAVEGATRLLHTGQRVRVDGERGWVHTALDGEAA